MLDFNILILSGAYASSVSVTLDILNAAVLLSPRAKAPRPSWRVLSPEGSAVALSSGLWIETNRLTARTCTDVSTWIIPGLGVDNPSVIQARLSRHDARRAIEVIRLHALGGGTVAASCSAVFLLQAAGILSKRLVTTSWWLAAELRRIEPTCVVDADRLVCTDGLINTAGAALAQSDLMLHLLRARFGVPLADAVSRTLLIDDRQAQAPFAIPSMMANGSELIRRLTQRIEASLPHLPSVATLAGEFAMSPRTFARHVRDASGRAPLALVQSVRLNRARQLIESTRMTIAQVAESVGYDDATALRRLMRKAAGATPSQFRSARQI